MTEVGSGFVDDVSRSSTFIRRLFLEDFVDFVDFVSLLSEVRLENIRRILL